jgi:endonuclease/exonuclease/phosphatase family metal-dependent hydrolase
MTSSSLLSRLFSSSPRRIVVNSLSELFACDAAAIASVDAANLHVKLDDVASLNLTECQRAERFLDACKVACPVPSRRAIATRRLNLQIATDDGVAPLWHFDDTAGRWTLMDVSQLAASVAQESPRRRVTLLTFNVWFDQFAADVRTDALVDVIAKHSPDIVCLQETTPRMLARLLATDSVRRTFVTTDACGGETHDAWYGTVTLVKREIAASAAVHFQLRSFPNSSQGRRALIVHVGALDLAVCNVHLESMNAAPERAQQLGIVHAMLAPTSAAIVCGDFNLNANPEPPAENASMLGILHDFVDTWDQLHPGEPGTTFDTQDNAMMSGFTSFFCQSRIDRIMARSVDLASIEIVGRETVSTVPGIAMSRNVCVSDHFGLVAQFDVKLPTKMKDAQDE